MLMSLGGFKFKMNTAAYQSFQRTTNYRWPALNRYGQRPARQYTGPGDETINVSGTIYPGQPSTLPAPVDVMDQLRERAASGKALAMVNGRGQIMGRWVVLSINENHSVFFADGTPRKIEFSMSLAHYGARRALQ